MKKISNLFLVLLFSLGITSCKRATNNTPAPTLTSSVETTAAPSLPVVSPSPTKEPTPTIPQKVTPTPQIETCKVVFYPNNNTSFIVVEVEKGKTVSKPANPTKDNYIFMCWCIDKALEVEYDFSKPVTDNFVLYAKYIVDYQKVTNKISTDIISANIVVTTISYNKNNNGSVSTYSGKSGSGIIIYEANDYYIALTNNHVTCIEDGYSYVYYGVSDYKNNDYTSVITAYTDPMYDLSIIMFTKGTEKLRYVSSSRATNPSVGEDIVLLGQPDGQMNTITFGNVQDYIDMSKQQSMNVKVECFKHSCYSDHGSSGGAILDMNLNLVGITCGGSKNSDGQFLYGIAIPIEKITEFIADFVEYAKEI